MTSRTIIGFSILGLIGLYFLRLKNTITDLQYTIAGVGLKFDGITPVLRIDLKISNIHDSSLELKGISGSLYTNGALVGNVQSVSPITVPGKSAAIYSLDIRLSLVGIAQDIVKVFNGAGIQQQIQFTGNAAVDNLILPIDFKYLIG